VQRPVKFRKGADTFVRDHLSNGGTLEDLKA
jgi:hypothetical protein